MEAELATLLFACFLHCVCPGLFSSILVATLLDYQVKESGSALTPFLKSFVAEDKLKLWIKAFGPFLVAYFILSLVLSCLVGSIKLAQMSGILYLALGFILGAKFMSTKSHKSSESKAKAE